jgi:hypothetical protein
LLEAGKYLKIDELSQIHELSQLGPIGLSRHAREDEDAEVDSFAAAMVLAGHLGFLHIKEDLSCRLNISGQIWHLADRRLAGEELMENAKPNVPAGTCVTFNDKVDRSNFAIGSQATQNIQAGQVDIRAVIADILTIITDNRENLEISSDESERLDEAVGELEQMARESNPDRGRLSRATSTVAQITGQLILGAGGQAYGKRLNCLSSNTFRKTCRDRPADASPKLRGAEQADRHFLLL